MFEYCEWVSKLWGGKERLGEGVGSWVQKKKSAQILFNSLRYLPLLKYPFLVNIFWKRSFRLFIANFLLQFDA